MRTSLVKTTLSLQLGVNHRYGNLYKTANYKMMLKQGEDNLGDTKSKSIRIEESEKGSME